MRSFLFYYHFLSASILELARRSRVEMAPLNTPLHDARAPARHAFSPSGGEISCFSPGDCHTSLPFLTIYTMACAAFSIQLLAAI